MFLKYALLMNVIVTFHLPVNAIVRVAECRLHSCFICVCDVYQPFICECSCDSCFIEICGNDRCFDSEYGHQQTYAAIVSLSYINNYAGIWNRFSTDTRVVGFKTSAASGYLLLIQRQLIIPDVQNEPD
jgi:hypothetical protein